MTTCPLAPLDAAYALGALEPAEARRFAAHLPACPQCTAAVAELGRVRDLLGQVPAAAVAALSVSTMPDAVTPDAARPDTAGAADLEPDAVTPHAAGVAAAAGAEVGGSPSAAGDPPEHLLADLLAAARRARRRRRVTVVTAALLTAAACLALVLVLVGPFARSVPTPAGLVPMTAVADSPVTARVAVVGEPWGTRIDMDCAYRAGMGPAGYGAPGSSAYAMAVVNRAGQVQQLATWTVPTGQQVSVSGTTAWPAADIAAVQLRSTDGATLLTLAR